MITAIAPKILPTVKLFCGANKRITMRKYSFVNFVLRCANNSRMRFVLLVVPFAIALFLVGCAAPPAEPSRYPIREQVEERPASIPTPTPQTPIYRPLDPSGQPQ
jgi:hypothetical protein